MSRKFRFKPTLAGYAASTPGESPEESHREQFTLRLVTALRGGRESVEDLPASFSTFATAQREADRMQDDFDDEAAPVTVYVIAASDGVPIYRGGAMAREADRPERGRVL